MDAAVLVIPALGLLTYYIMKDYKIKKQARAEGLTYKEMKSKIKESKLNMEVSE